VTLACQDCPDQGETPVCLAALEEEDSLDQKESLETQLSVVVLALWVSLAHLA